MKSEKEYLEKNVQTVIQKYYEGFSYNEIQKQMIALGIESIKSLDIITIAHKKIYKDSIKSSRAGIGFGILWIIVGIILIAFFLIYSKSIGYFIVTLGPIIFGIRKLIEEIECYPNLDMNRKINKKN
jgi:hypothetical protein